MPPPRSPSGQAATANLERPRHRAAPSIRNRVILVCRQPVSLGRIHAGQVVTVAVSETTIAVELGDGDTRVVSRTTTLPVRNVKALRVGASAK